MFESPWLQDNIWTNLLLAARVHFMTNFWWLWMIIVFVILSCAVLVLGKSLRTAPAYSHAADFSIYLFDRTRKSDWLGLTALVTAVALTATRMFYVENSLFENFDLMALNTTQAMWFGLPAAFSEVRVVPLIFWYLGYLYAITQNIYLIKLFVLAQLILVFVLLYCLFDFIPVARRLVMLALFALSPAMFSTANIIFAERDVIIALAADLIFAKRYCRTKKLSSFSGFLFFMTVAVYTKETCCLFFGGLLATSLLWNIWTENITLKSFLHPFRTIKTFPVEFMIALNLFLYATIYFLMIQPTMSYASSNTFDPIFLLSYYKFELVVLATALSLCVASCYKMCNTPVNPLFRSSGFLCSAAFLAGGLILVVRVTPSSPHLYEKTYYLVLSMLFSLAYIFQHLQNKKALCFLSLILITCSLSEDLRQYRNEVGVYYRETAEFFAKKLNKEQTNIIFIAEKRFEKPNLTIWISEVYSSSYRYYFKDYRIVFKMVNPSVFDVTYGFNPMLFPIISNQTVPKTGDWLVLNKNESYPDIEKMVEKQTPDFENKLFKVYHIK